MNINLTLFVQMVVFALLIYGTMKWISLALLDDKGRSDKSYFMSRVEANADATKSFPIDRSGRYVLRLAVQGPETTNYRIELGGNALASSN